MKRTLPSMLFVIVASLSIGACGTPSATQQDVAQRGEEVMPFELEATTHRFVPTPDGLVETVVADAPDDRVQERLVREHLRSEALRFQRGDFDDPAAIHGETMPGLAELRAHDGAVSVTYRPVSGGAEIVFRSRDAELVDALHAWGAAQVSDHGEHAEG